MNMAIVNNIYYCEIANVGDQLNRWLWHRVYPSMDWLGDRLFLGVGTLLNNRVPLGIGKVVLGAGCGYRPSPDIHRDHWTIAAVRGPLTAQQLGLDPDHAVSDAAILTADHFPTHSIPKQHKRSVIFQHHSYTYWDWTDFLESQGIHVIDPAWDVERVLHDIAASETVAAEAMHGAILADTLRVPWVPFKMYPQVYDFKWHDWAASLNLTYRPIEFNPLFRDTIGHPYQALNRLHRIPGTGSIRNHFRRRAQKQLQNAFLEGLRNAPSVLSQDAVFVDRLGTMRDRADQLSRPSCRAAA
ncbi:Exopolysaccharide glucosyl ketal-pyruvate-transferase [Mucisphaera calidilacus]|uniref:Exopolysaccharide glucosyl ketal-pyruvate-transferase n=2 Tax=Mucisphaera calidilacus TaxID=2527982 RepID=A0A518BTL4_9BACT|nr:Exopolysaccharide glucosyl ketal-pyruvate-transferase [Mucisphaera calidilacus]